MHACMDGWLDECVWIDVRMCVFTCHRLPCCRESLNHQTECVQCTCMYNFPKKLARKWWRQSKFKATTNPFFFRFVSFSFGRISMSWFQFVSVCVLLLISVATHISIVCLNSFTIIIFFFSGALVAYFYFITIASVTVDMIMVVAVAVPVRA